MTQIWFGGCNWLFYKVKNSFCVCREFLSLMLINWICQTKSESDLFLYTRNLSNELLKPVFEYKIPLWICVLVLSIHKGYCVVKSWCKMFVLKISGIQKNPTFWSLIWVEKYVFLHLIISELKNSKKNVIFSHIRFTANW